MVKTGTPGFWPHDILSNPDVIQSAVHNNKITPTALVDITRSFIKATSGDLSKVNLSYTSSWRYRNETVADITQRIKDTWVPPSVAAIHWDGKLMNYLNNGGQQERLPVLITGEGGVKLLGVPTIEKKAGKGMAGKEIASQTIKLTDQWDAKDSIAAMVFDTTSINTGSKTAACIWLQEMTDKELLCLLPSYR